MPTPVTWGPRREEEFVAWITHELQQAIDDRSGLETTWRDRLDQYRAPEATETKNFPFTGAPLARDTEIMLTTGWTRIDEVKVGDYALTRRDMDGLLEWAYVEAVPRVYAEKLYHFKSKSIDLKVSPEHAMVCQTQTSGKTVRIPAKKLWGKTGYFLPHVGRWEGNGKTHLEGLRVEDVCELVGWYLAEGCIGKGYLGKPNAILIFQSKEANSAKCHRLEALFNRLGWIWSRYKSSYRISRQQIPEWLFNDLVAQQGCKNKFVPRRYFEMSPSAIEALLTGLVLGDGSIVEVPGGGAPSVNYFTTSRALADDIQVLALFAGLHARIHRRFRFGCGGTIDGRKISGEAESYEVAFCPSVRAKYDRSYREIVDYNDTAFCVTVKNHAIYARRNGIACWTGNSNRTIPLTAMNVDPLVARFMTTYHAPPNLWTLQALNEKWVPLAKPLQDYLQFLDQNVLRMWDVDYRAVLELIKLGTCIYKHGWLFERRNAWAYGADGRPQRVTKLLSRPFVDHVRLIDFVIPPAYYSIQPDDQGGAPWVAERHQLRLDQFLARAEGQDPFLPNYNREGVAKVKHFVDDKRDTVQAKVDDLEGNQPFRWETVTLHEVHARYDCQGNGQVDDIVAIVHLDSRTLLRATLNYYAHGERPYEVSRYFRSDGFYGIGVCEQMEMFQSELSDLSNFQHDNVMLRNSLTLAVKQGANFLPGEPIYPGKAFILDDPSKDIKELRFGEAYPSTVQLLSLYQSLSERRSGLSDIQFGSVQQLPSRTPATTMMSLLQEGNRRFDLSLKDMRIDCLARIGLRVLQNLQQFASNPVVNPDGDAYLQLAIQTLGQPEGSLVAGVLQMPLEDVGTGIGVSLTATSGMVNKEIEKQGFLALVQLQTQLGTQFIQLAQIATNPQVVQMMPGLAEVAVQVAKGFTELQRRLLEQYDIRNPEDILVDASILQSASQAAAAGGVGPAGALGPAGPGAPFPDDAAGMGGLPPGA